MYSSPSWSLYTYEIERCHKHIQAHIHSAHKFPPKNSSGKELFAKKKITRGFLLIK